MQLERRMPVTGRVIFGLVVIALGIVFTLDNLGLMNASEVLRAWPVLLIGYGVMRITGFSGRQNLVSGIIFSGIGTWLLLHNYDLIALDPWDLWPLLLVLLGISMVMGSLARSRARNAEVGSDSSFSAFALMSGTERKVTSADFRGGDCTAIMGGHVIDLRSARIAQPNGVAVIDVLVWWGGVDIKIPADWTVSSEALPVMGAVEDSSQAPTGPVTGRLLIKGIVVMGGVEVKN